MDLVAGVKRCIVTMEHVNKKGESKILPACTLPLTGRRCIDMVITELAVLEMDHGKRRFVLKETAPGVTVEEVLAKTKAEVLVPQSVGTVACS
jgi:3-oxoacid CoA-transferase B subunit